jgi:hypothetical protein
MRVLGEVLCRIECVGVGNTQSNVTRQA